MTRDSGMNTTWIWPDSASGGVKGARVDLEHRQHRMGRSTGLRLPRRLPFAIY